MHSLCTTCTEQQHSCGQSKFFICMKPEARTHQHRLTAVRFRSRDQVQGVLLSSQGVVLDRDGLPSLRAVANLLQT